VLKYRTTGGIWGMEEQFHAFLTFGTTRTLVNTFTPHLFTHEEIPPNFSPGTCWTGDWVARRTGLDVSEEVFPLGCNNVKRTRRTGSLRRCGARGSPAGKTRKALDFCRFLQAPSAAPPTATGSIILPKLECVDF